MSIKKSFRITLIVFAFLPILLILFLTKQFVSTHVLHIINEDMRQLSLSSEKCISFIIKSDDVQSDVDFAAHLKENSEYIDNVLSMAKDCHAQVLQSQGSCYYAFNTEFSSNSMISNERLHQLFRDYQDHLLPATGSFESNSDEGHYVYGYTFFPNSDFVFLVCQEATSTIPYKTIFLFFLACTVLFILPLSIVINHYYQKEYIQPIMSIKKVMRTAANGDLNVTSTIKSRNELGELSRSLNKMLHIIKGNYDELTSMHERLIENEDQLRNNYDRIEYLAYHDVLTNLSNRLSFVDFTNVLLAGSKVSKDHHAFYFIDLDNFKMINDTLGHDYGDILLKQTADRLHSLLSDDDFIARAGGDEFMIIKPNIADASAALHFGQTIIDYFKMPFNLNGEAAYVSMSIGVSVYPENGLETAALVKNADIAMYQSKDTGKNRCTLFDSKMEEQLNYKNLVLDVLRNAIHNSEIYLLYQPQVSLKDHKIIGYEALMRIYNPRLGLLSPHDFIPIAEESGIINELGAWALREACRFNKSLIDSGITPCVVSVNISPVQINRFDFFDTLSDILKETGLPPHYLELELTESALVSSIIDTATMIQKFQDIGVRVALDDFGTGYSSLSYLAKMNIHTLKIDKSFIDNICVSEKELSMVHTIIRLAHHLGLQVIAEGVEHTAQHVLLKDKKCDIIQGFIFSKPLLSNDLISILRSVN